MISAKGISEASGEFPNSQKVFTGLASQVEKSKWSREWFWERRGSWWGLRGRTLEAARGTLETDLPVLPLKKGSHTKNRLLSMEAKWAKSRQRKGKIQIKMEDQESLKISWLYNFFCCLQGILVPWPRTEPVPCAVEAWTLNHWPTREVPWLLQNFNARLWK